MDDGVGDTLKQSGGNHGRVIIIHGFGRAFVITVTKHSVWLQVTQQGDLAGRTAEEIRVRMVKLRTQLSCLANQVERFDESSSGQISLSYSGCNPFDDVSRRIKG